MSKEVEKIMTVFIYEVEADTEEEALELYENELAGTLEPVNEYIDESEVEEGIKVI